jgi:hypothetical protein
MATRETADVGAAASAVSRTSQGSEETGTLVERVSETTAQCDPRARGGSMSDEQRCPSPNKSEAKR